MANTRVAFTFERFDGGIYIGSSIDEILPVEQRADGAQQKCLRIVRTDFPQELEISLLKVGR